MGFVLALVALAFTHSHTAHTAAAFASNRLLRPQLNWHNFYGDTVKEWLEQVNEQPHIGHMNPG